MRSGERSSPPTAESVTDARTLAREIGLLRSMAKYDLRRVVTFHSRVSFARRFASSLPLTSQWLPARRRPSGALWAKHVSGEMTAGERDMRLRQLKAVAADERGVLTNARCLTEGVDVPTLDGVAFIDPRRSQVDVVQAVGRAIRKAEDKTRGTIVIPVFVTDDDDPEQALESSEFNRVWEVVRALRDHDDALADELDYARREFGRRGTLGQRPAKLLLDLPSRVGIDFARAFDAKLIERTAASWEFNLGLLQRFSEREGHAEVPFKHVEEQTKLGHWVANRRRDRQRGRLSDDQISRLERLRCGHGKQSSMRGSATFKFSNVLSNGRVTLASPENTLRTVFGSERGSRNSGGPHRKRPSRRSSRTTRRPTGLELAAKRRGVERRIQLSDPIR